MVNVAVVGIGWWGQTLIETGSPACIVFRTR